MFTAYYISYLQNGGFGTHFVSTTTPFAPNPNDPFGSISFRFWLRATYYLHCMTGVLK